MRASLLPSSPEDVADACKPVRWTDMNAMLPREHGAYSQMVLPLATSLIVSHGAAPSLMIAIAVICGFLAHEPLLVLLGGRGVRAKQVAGARAAIWFSGTAMAAIAAGSAAFTRAAPTVRWSFLLPLVPASWVAASLFASCEKRASAEIAVALAFAFTSVPMCLAAGLSAAEAFSVGIVFGSVFVTGVLCVRAIVLAKRGGGRPTASRETRLLLVAVAAVTVIGLGLGVSSATLHWTTLLAVTPGLVAAVTLATRRSPPPLRTVGWSLALTSATAALILIGPARHLS